MIIRRFDPNVLAEVVRINDNVSNVDSLPGAGAIILIPRQTATATPEDFTPAPDLAQALGVGVEPTSPATGPECRRSNRATYGGGGADNCGHCSDLQHDA